MRIDKGVSGYKVDACQWIDHETIHIKQLMAMLEAEQNSDDKYGAHLTHWAGTAKSINIDERAILALIEHYEQRMQEGEE